MTEYKKEDDRVNLKVLGCYSPNYEGKPVSMYKLEINDKIVYMDIGYGNHNKIDYNRLEDTIIIISHNHIDHAYGLVSMLAKLKKDKVKLKKKIKVYMPKSSRLLGIYSVINQESEYIQIIHTNKNLKFYIDEYEISFCRTLHKGESYAIKFHNVKTNKVFVYTSDLYKVTDELIEFAKYADVIMMESGHPVLFQPFSLGKYHGYTRNLLSDIIKTNSKLIYLTHFKTYASSKTFEKWYPKTDIDIKLVKLNKEYEI